MSNESAQLVSAALVLAAGTLSPGPNNFIVMRAAARGGFAAALPAIGAIVLGSVALLALSSAGAASALARWPLLRQALAIGGCVYLSWLGVSLMRARPAAHAPVPDSAGGVFGFQLLNPKGWTLALTLVAAQKASSPAEILLRLAPLYAGIAAGGLALWALLGSRLRHVELRPAQRRWLDRALGAALALGAVLLLI